MKMWPREDLVRTDVSEKCVAIIFRAKKYAGDKIVKSLQNGQL
jgi:hypothetical protein